MNAALSPLVFRRACVRRLFAVCAALSAFSLGSLSVSAAVVPVFSDDFSDGNRTGWYYSSGSNDTLSVSSDASAHKLTGNALASAVGDSTGLVHFSSTTLAVGDSLTVSFKLSLSSITTPVNHQDYNLRFGVLNSGTGTTVSADGFGATSGFAGYGGYRLFYGAGSTYGGRSQIAKRDPVNTHILGSTWPSSLANAAGPNLSAQTAYSISVTFSRVSAGVLNIESSLNGIVMSGSDSSSPNFTFDTLAYTKSSTLGTLYLDDVLVTHTSSIPEPSSAVLLSGLAAGAIAFVRRRARG